MGSRRAESSTIRLAFHVLPRVGAPRACFRTSVTALALFGIATALCSSSAQAIELASVGLFGAPGNNASNGVATNTDGTFVAFFSDASNLVPNDTNGARDVFIRDLSLDVTQRISVNSAGQQANGPSQNGGGSPAMSGDGQVVAFYSNATNLVAADINGQPDVFVRVRNAGVTEIISVSSTGTQGNGPSVSPSLSTDGRFVAFQSLASNLVPGDTNGVSDIFVRDRVAQTTERVCGVQGNGSSSAPAISADGNFVAFSSAATNLVPGDTNNQLDIFVCNRGTGAIQRVSVSSNGTQGDGDSILPAINADGTVVGFKSLADNLVSGDTNGVVDVFVRDRAAGTTERISVNTTGGNANDFSFPPSLSNDGRYVAFGSFATNLVANDANHSSDVFVRDRRNAFTVLVDRNALGVEANGGVPDIAPAISGNGKQVAFVSVATNLVASDTNGVADVYSTLNEFFGHDGCPDGICPDGQVCVQGFCAVATPTVAPSRTPTPTLTRTPGSTATPTATFRQCTDDSQCHQPDEHCRGGTCKKDRPCDDSNPAIDRHACFDRETCIDNLCECGGDCNLDGFVFVNEINKAMKILNGLESVTQCTAADIDGDGTVMSNEITLIVLNSGLGCVQEGQPLIFSHDRGGMVTLTVGAVAGAPGDTVTVPIDLGGGQGEVATAQMDLLFDPNVMTIADPENPCTKDARLTEHVFSALTTNSPPPPTGLQRLRLFVGDITPPVATFDDGRIATCTFQLKAGAMAASLTADRLNVGDAHGDVFGSQAVTGGVSILVPTPTPGGGVGHAPCPGDCDADGNVQANEITVAVRIMAGESPLSDCAAADADGDGQVFVTDITRAIIALATGCPE